jgi:hypothetical protein
MPFTFAHAAVILPFEYLKKNKLSLTGLIAGSIVPDFEYFIKMKGDREYGHSVFGLFWFDLPLALILAFVFHVLIRNPLLNNLPSFLQRRFIKEKDFNWPLWLKQYWLRICLSIIVGAASHLLLDSFTNQNGYFVKAIPFLQQSYRTDYTALYYNNILSYVLSIAGCLVMLFAILQLPADQRAKINKPQMLYWLLALLFTILITFIKTNAIDNERMKQYWYLYIASYVIIAVAAFLLSIVFTSLLFTLKEKVTR